MECVKNDFRQIYGYAFRHTLLGYGRLCELLSELAGHVAATAPSPSNSRCLVLVPPRRGSAVPVDDLRRLLIEKMRAVRAAQGTQDEVGLSRYVALRICADNKWHPQCVL
jgi:hypothetical protein